jgi:hypothetical protein
MKGAAEKETLMLQLTVEQQREVVGRDNQPIRLVDPATSQEHVLLRAEVYEKLSGCLDDSLDRKQVAALIEKNMREDDANDPLLESYQKYRR